MRFLQAAVVLALLSPAARAAEPTSSASHERLKELTTKLEAGALSPEESREFLRALARQALGEEAPSHPPAQQPSDSQTSEGGHKVIAVYGDRNSTKLVVEARRPLVAGSAIFAGTQETEATLLDLLSRSGDLYYYAATAPGRVPIAQGDAVVTRRTRTLNTPSPLRLKVSESYTFEPKRRGEITAVQEGRAMIDRGTLHEVRERDVYRVYAPDGHYKGMLEIRGIGDLQSSGELYDRLESRAKDALKTAPGDRVVFAGQRKLTALGILGGIPASRDGAFGQLERTVGAGLLWDVTFQDGWGVETLFGFYGRTLKESRQVKNNFNPDFYESLGREAKYICPTWVKKSFFFPSIATPFVAAGLSFFSANLNYEATRITFGTVTQQIREHSTPVRIIPVYGGGVEFFAGRLIRPRLEVRWFDGPTVKSGPETFETRSTFVSLGLFTAW